MATFSGYMAWPGRAAAEAMVAGARTSAAATTAAAPATPAGDVGPLRQRHDRRGAVEDPRQVSVGDLGVELIGSQLDPKGVGRLHQRHELIGQLDRAPVQQGVQVVVPLVRLRARHPHRSSSS
jgi:hypothetical protein